MSETPAAEETHRPLPISFAVVLGAVIALLAVAARAELIHYQSIDFKTFLLPWWKFIGSHNGVHALRHQFADYNVPYLYILVILHHLAPNHPLAAIKAVSIGFDIALAGATYLLVALRQPGYRRPAAAGLTVLLLPTVILNSSLWAQCDAIYTTFLLAGLYLLIRRRPWLACTLFGVAYAFKQQAMFLFPILLILALRRELPWRTLLAIPAAFLLLDIPALIIGRPPGELLRIYTNQAGGYQQLTLNAASVYQLLPANVATGEIRKAGILFAAAIVLLLAAAIATTRQHLTPHRLLLTATLFTLAVPFLLPSMHERYLYAADVLSVIIAFQAPRRLWFIPLLVQYASATAYAPFLLDSHPAPPQIPALAALAVIVFLTVHVIHALYPPKPANLPADAATQPTQRTTDPEADELPA